MDYQGNSDKDKEIRGDKQITKVITGEVIRKPDTIARKFKNVFFGGDVKTSARFVAADVILPAFRDLVVDAIINTAKGVIYGDSSIRRRTAEYRPRIQYSNPINRTYVRDNREPIDRRPYLPDQPRMYRQPGNLEYRNVVLTNKGDAEVIVERLIDIIDKFETASVADYYDLMEQPSSPIDNKWGWSHLNNVEIRQTRDGYVIELPPVEAI